MALGELGPVIFYILNGLWFPTHRNGSPCGGSVSTPFVLVPRLLDLTQTGPVYAPCGLFCARLAWLGLRINNPTPPKENSLPRPLGSLHPIMPPDLLSSRFPNRWSLEDRRNFVDVRAWGASFEQNDGSRHPLPGILPPHPCLDPNPLGISQIA